MRRLNLLKATAISLTLSMTFQPLVYASAIEVQTEEQVEESAEEEVVEEPTEEQTEELVGKPVEEVIEKPVEESIEEQVEEVVEEPAVRTAEVQEEEQFSEYTYSVSDDENFVDGVMSNPDGYEKDGRGAGYDLKWTTVNGKKVMLDGYGKRFGYGECKKVIDVSSYNGNVDWQAVKKDGVDGAVLRITSFAGGPMHEDDKFGRNVAECRKVGVPFGVYMYSYATNTEKAAKEANYVVSLLKKYNIKPSELPYSVYYDLESNDITSSLSVAQNVENVKTFVKILQANGYPVNVYSYTSYLNTNLNSPEIYKYVSWVAQYGKALTFKNNYYKGNYGWQYRSNGKVAGISGEVDVNCFSDFYGYDTQNTVGAPLGRDESTPHIEYRANNKAVEWLPYFTEPNTAGTTGRNLPLYQLQMKLNNVPNSAHLSGQIEYAGGKAAYENIEKDTVIGVQDKAMRRVKFDLSNVPGYCLEYRVHSSNIGWQAWTKQGLYAGDAAQDIQAIEFRMVEDKTVVVNEPQIYYSAHIANAGWLDYVSDSQVAGKVGNKTPIQALYLGIDGEFDYKFSGSVYIDGLGWKEYSEILTDTVVGTVGQSKEIKAVAFDMENADGYGLQYAVNVSNVGWQNWKNAGEIAGDLNFKNSVEAIKFRLLKNPNRIDEVVLDQKELSMNTGDEVQLKAVVYPEYTTLDKKVTWSSSDSSVAEVDAAGNVTAKKVGTAVIKATAVNGTSAECTVKVVKRVPNVNYTTHVQDIGWQTVKENGETAGTTNQLKRLEAITIDISNSDDKGGVQYRTHIQDIGWQEWRENGDESGTSGQAKRLEAIQMKLTDELSEKYDIYYRVHAQQFGWLDWAKNGELAGTSGYGYRLEAIQIRLAEKGGKAPGETAKPFKQKYVRYQTHIQDIGWQAKKTDGEISGTVGKSKRLEGIKLTLADPRYSGGIQYKTHIQDIGWQGWKENGAMSGTSGQKKRLEAIKIQLTGKMAENYDIYYRVHAQNFGWMGWAKNGQSAGTAGYAYRLEGIQVVIVEKGAKAPGSTDKCFVER